MAARKKPIPTKPKPGLRGVRPVFCGQRWQFRAVATFEGRRVVGPLRDDAGSAHRDYLGLRERCTTPTGPVLTLAEGLAAVLGEQRARGRASERSRNSTKLICEALMRAWKPEMLLSDINAEELNWYVRTAGDNGRNTTTILEKDLPTLRAALKAGNFRWPTEFAAPRRPRRTMSVLTSNEVAHLLQRIRTEEFRHEYDYPLDLSSRALHADLIELLYLSGLRLGELCRLTAADVDTFHCTLTVRNHKDAGSTLQASTEHVVLSQHSRDLLARLVARAAPASQKSVRKRLPAKGLGSLLLVPGGESYMNTMFARWKERLGEPRLCGRTLRHSFVSASLQITGDLAATRDLARHRSVQTTSRYVHALTQRQSATRAALFGLIDRSQAADS
jgi:integrase